MRIVTGLLAMLTVSQSVSAEHPKLFFSAADVPALRERAKTTHRRYVQAAQAMFDWDVKSSPALPQSPTGMDAWPIEPWTARLVNATMLWAVTGDPHVAAQAKDWLLGLCKLRPQADNSYTYGFYAIALAVGYDVLYSELIPEQRETVGKQLAAVAQGLYESNTGAAKARLPGWWRGLLLHHDCVIPICGQGVAALALAGEDVRWQTWYQLPRDQTRQMLTLLGDDGLWHEGVSGWSYAMSALMPFVEAARNVAKDDFYRFAWLKNTAQTRLHLRLPGGGYFNFGDSYRDGGYGGMGSTGSHTLRLLASRYGDGYAQWLAEQEEAADFARFEKSRATSRPDSLPPGNSQLASFYSVGWSLVWFDPKVASRPPAARDLPTHHLCGETGYVTVRSGWGDDAAMLTFRAGPVTGAKARQYALTSQPETADLILESFEHAHVDENVVTFFASGVYWLSPPGYGARSSGRQTTLLIGGVGSRQQEKNFGDCRLLRSEFAPWGTYLLGDATAAYPSDVGLNRFHRHVVTPAPGVVVICDDVRASGPVTTEWRMHPGEKLAVTPQNNKFLLKSAPAVPKAEGAEMVVEFLAPDKLTLAGPTTQPLEAEKDRKIPHQLLKMAYCLARPEGPAADTRYLVVIAPPAVRPRRLSVAGGEGVTIETPAGRCAVIFNLDPAAPAETLRLSYSTDEKLATELVVGLPANMNVQVRRQVRAGVATVTIQPGQGTQTSAAGTLRLDKQGFQNR